MCDQKPKWVTIHVSYTLTRAHTENRWELYKALSKRLQRRRPLVTPTTLTRHDITTQERRETRRKSGNGDRRVLNTTYRRPSRETNRRPHMTLPRDGNHTVTGPPQVCLQNELWSTTWPEEEGGAATQHRAMTELR